MGNDNKIKTTDEPVSCISEDRLSLNNYVESLSEFICMCDTPMTISIQGDWGSGKTSIMNMVKESLGNKVYPIMFNTWQYSLFSSGNQLSISLISHLVNQLGANSDKTNKQVIKFVKSLIGGTIKNVTNDIIDIDKFIENTSKQQDDIAVAILELKKQLEELVQEKVKSENVSRVVIFIDDLDRLQPEKALELLEVIKVFLDCKQCVFILAIDYDVVTQGIRNKFGDSVTEEKGKSFFDKIIQLPFRMPVAHFQMDQYLKDYVEEVIGDSDRISIEKYKNIINDTIGTNPRGIKRAFNAFKLIDLVADKEGVYKKSEIRINIEKKRLLFLLICIQLANEKTYNYILDFPEINKDLISKLSEEEYRESIIRGIYNNRDVEEHVSDKIITMIRDFCELCNELVDNGTKKEDYSSVNEIISFSSITSNVEKKDKRKVEYGTLEDLIALVNPSEKIQKLYGRFEENILSLGHVEKRVTMGEKRVVFYVKENEKSNNFAIIEFRKGSLVIAPFLPESFKDDMAEKIGVPISAHHFKCHINQVMTEDMIEKILPYIDQAYKMVCLKSKN